MKKKFILLFLLIVISLLWFVLYESLYKIDHSEIISTILKKKTYFQNNLFYIVPNIVHYILLEQHFISFAHYITLKSVIRNQKPDKIMIHCDCYKVDGKCWNHIIIEENNINIQIRKIEIPDAIFGQELSQTYKLWHASDILRINVLLDFGGIYLDRDVYVTKSLNRFRLYEMTAGIETDDKGKKLFGSQVQIANKNASFLLKYLETHKDYDPDQWYYNAGYLPMDKIIEKDAKLINLTSELGTNSYEVLPILYLQNSKTWQNDFFSLYLLMRGNSLLNNFWWSEYNEMELTQFDEINIKTLNTTFGQMARLIFYNTTDFVD